MTTTEADFHDKRMPNESPEYRAARNELLAQEVTLREQLERVAALRRQLPLGGELKEDYEFEEIDLSGGSTRPIRFSEIFGENTDLLVYSYMYGPDWESPCPSCTSVIDGINAASRHVRQQVELVVIGKAHRHNFTTSLKNATSRTFDFCRPRKTTMHATTTRSPVRLPNLFCLS